MAKATHQPHLGLQGHHHGLLEGLRHAARERDVAPPGQPFAFRTRRGNVRRANEDTALVITGRRAKGAPPYLAGILCDGMGGLPNGDAAATLAAAVMGRVLAGSELLSPTERMRAAIIASNAEVFAAFSGRSGAVVV